MPVGAAGARQRSQSAPGSTPDDDRVQSVASVSRLEMAAPSPTGWATHVVPEVSTTHPPVGSTNSVYGWGRTCTDCAASPTLKN